VTGWHREPMCGLHVAATSVDVETARIVAAAIVVWRGAGAPETLSWLADPATDIETPAYGITAEEAHANGVNVAVVTEEITSHLAALMLEMPVVVYDAAYGFTVVDRECRRCEITPLADLISGCSAHVIDPHVIDKHVDPHREGPRSLPADCRYYGVKTSAPRTAIEDAATAMRLVWKIGGRYPDLATLPLGKLHDLQARARNEQAAQFEASQRRRGIFKYVDGSWPVRPCTGQVAA
jgi:DNA polymerase III subunit epsilon